MIDATALNSEQSCVVQTVAVRHVEKLSAPTTTLSEKTRGVYLIAPLQEFQNHEGDEIYPATTMIIQPKLQSADAGAFPVTKNESTEG